MPQMLNRFHSPVTHQPGGPLDAPLAAIGERLSVTADQVLLAWAKAKGAVVVTTSSKESRLKGYQAAGDLALTDDDIAKIDAAGAEGTKSGSAWKNVRAVAVVALYTIVASRVLNYFGFSFI
ncbi:hypothetical protein HGRIS_014256 [Hohenbuehelia grisea]|uniref:NADP-dependent oxidoreductase domain-containing protein n=1 Tax=Hohenbuehelia grisea TaxID=104357 RepID=A0ABR3JTN1_9AGAR